MIKHQPPPMRMRVERGRLVPATAYDAERLDSYRVGSTVNVKFTADRMRPLERKYRAILGKVIKECKTPWSNAQTAHEAIKLACGYVNVGKTTTGKFMQWPRSLVDFDDAEMEAYFEQAMAVLSSITGLDIETMKSESAHIGTDEDEFDPETGEILPTDTVSGATASQAPKSDEPLPVSSQEPADVPPVASAGSLSNQDAENPAASGQDAANQGHAMAASELIPEEKLSAVDRSLLIECCAKFMQMTVRQDLRPDERRNALEKAKDAWKRELRPDLHPKLASMFLSADSIIRGKVDRAGAIAEFADWLECKPEEIGG